MNEEQIAFVAKLLPHPKANTGRPSYSNRDLLPGILRVLRSGMRWRDLDDKNLPSDVTHWRRLRFWEKKFGLKDAWNFILQKLNKAHKLNLNTASIDGSVVSSFNFFDAAGYSGKYKKTGTKISTLVDFPGTPFNVLFASGEKHDMPLAMATIVNNTVGKPGTILADKGYDSNKFRLKLREFGISPNIPNRNIKNRKPDPDYNPDLGKMRFKVERTNAWIKSFRRLRFRFDYTLKSFSALIYLGLIVICIRKLI